ncbi:MULTISPECIES: hypothetical protein [Streptomyces]|uniref:hypothetical protein n=1 Tax=Streptomyces TaxID=1883 RepID=UPI0004CCBDA8|nr:MULTISPECIES: hypothetical protein [Streptomyces]KOT47260.1 hypothetical protein ADK43_39875 [Streptomyces rimosus subsp. rimosus]
MGFRDRMTGTKRPARGVAPRSADEVRAVLLGLNGPKVPYAVRSGALEGADLVGEWRISDPAWRTFFARARTDGALQVRMRLVPASCEVRALDRQWEVTWTGGTPRVAVSAEYFRGQVKTVSRRWTPGRGPDGRLQVTEDFRCDSAQMKDPLRDAVLEAGWTWRAVAFGKL